MNAPKIYSLVKINTTKQARLAELRAFAARHDAAWRKYASFSRNGASSATPEQCAKIVAEAGDFTNELRAELETLEFLADPPAKVFVYPAADQMGIARLTGFMGNTLLYVSALGRKFRSNVGDERQSVHAVGINGIRYNGTIYGTYARLSVCKAALKS